jgi:hypothetical protein
LEDTSAERGPAPLVGALGSTLSKLAAVMQRNHRVDFWSTQIGLSVKPVGVPAAHSAPAPPALLSLSR